MKKSIITLSIIFASLAGFGQTQPVQEEKKFKIELTAQQIDAILAIINDAKLDGETRRYWSNLLLDQARKQLPQPAPIQRDSTGVKPKKDK